jgi:hypothetical protein
MPMAFLKSLHFSFELLMTNSLYIHN